MRSPLRTTLRALLPILLVACGGDASGPKIGPPSALTVVSGSGQTGLVGTALSQPVIVRVTDAQNQPVQGVAISFSVASGGGSISPASAVTDATGSAQTVWTLGTNASTEQKLEARAAGVTAVASFSATAQPGAASQVTKAGGDAQSGPVGLALSSELAVRVADQYSNPITGATVSWSVVSGGGSVAPSTSQTGTDGVARARWTLGGTLAAQSVSATVTGVPGQQLFAATGTPGAVASIAVEPPAPTIGIGQTRQFTATLRDAFNNAITGRTITWSSQTASIATVDANGLARGVAAGTTQITASAEGRTGTATLTVQEGTVLSPVISGVAPALLLAGESATITGANFSPTMAANAVTINNVRATVMSATATQLTVLMPSRTELGCQPTRTLNLAVDVGGNVATRPVSVATATQRTLARGEFLNLTGDEIRCNELGLGNGRYLIAVTNVATNVSSSSAFNLRGGAAATGLSADPALAARVQAAATALQRRTLPESFEEAQRRVRSHRLVQAANLEFIRQMKAQPQLDRRIASARVSAAAAPPPPNVGDTISLRMSPSLSISCNSFTDVRARVVYVGTRGVLLEDVTAPLPGQVDSLYQRLGAEFDTSMYPVIANNFADPLIYDSRLDDNQRLFMLFSPRVNENQSILGYVRSADFYPRTACATSNGGEVFYARVPTTTAPGQVDNIINWYRQVRTVVVHEVKHLASYATRFNRTNGNPAPSDLEEGWLEEATAMLSEEIWARSVFNYAQRGNVGYRASIYCEVRPTTQECLGKPLSMFDHFFLLHDFETEIEIRSALGPTSTDDQTYYGSGWAFLRWAVDHYGTTESAFLRALTTSTARGVANLSALTGRPIEEMLTDFGLSLALDDRTGFTATRPQHTMPSWNVPDMFNGLATDFPSQCNGPCFLAAPLAKRTIAFGDFSVAVPGVRGGTLAVFELSGTQVGKQLVELSSSSGGVPASNLRFSIVRVE